MLDLAEFAALVAEFRRKGTDLARSPGRQILAVRFALRGVGLALGGDKQRALLLLKLQREGDLGGCRV